MNERKISFAEAQQLLSTSNLHINAISALRNFVGRSLDAIKQHHIARSVTSCLKGMTCTALFVDLGYSKMMEKLKSLHVLP